MCKKKDTFFNNYWGLLRFARNDGAGKGSSGWGA